MVRKRIVDKEDKIPAMTTYVPNSLKLRHQKVCKALGVSQSVRVRKLLEDDCVAFEGGKIQKDFDFEEAKALRWQWRKQEIMRRESLQKELHARGKTSYDIMMLFAVSLGTDNNLEKDAVLVLNKLKRYDLVGNESFNNSTLETFIEYFEAVIKRREIEAKIKEERQRCLATEELASVS